MRDAAGSASRCCIGRATKGKIRIPYGTLIDEPALKPTAHIYVGSKASWYETSTTSPGTTSPPGLYRRRTLSHARRQRLRRVGAQVMADKTDKIQNTRSAVRASVVTPRPIANARRRDGASRATAAPTSPTIARTTAAAQSPYQNTAKLSDHPDVLRTASAMRAATMQRIEANAARTQRSCRRPTVVA